MPEWRAALARLVAADVTEPSIREGYGEIVSDHVGRIERSFVSLSNVLPKGDRKAVTLRTARLYEAELTLHPSVGTFDIRMDPSNADWLEELCAVAVDGVPARILYRPDPASTLVDILDVEFPTTELEGFEPYPLKGDDRDLDGCRFVRGSFHRDDAGAAATFTCESLQAPLAAPPPAPSVVPAPEHEPTSKALLEAIRTGRITMTVRRQGRQVAVRFVDGAGESLVVQAVPAEPS